MKALLTGASGFIGGNLARELVRGGYSVRALIRHGANRRHLADLDLELVEGDLLDQASLQRAIRGCGVVFHAAALYTFWAPDPNLIYRTNVEGTQNLLAASLSAGIQRLVFTSSESTIGIRGGMPGTEKDEARLDELPGQYKKSKLLAERAALEYCRRGLPVIVVNPTMPIGPGDVKPTPTGQMVVDFLSGRMPATFRTGMNVVDVADVAAGHLLALERGRPGERYILGNRNVSFHDILRILSGITGLPCPRFELPPWVALGAAWVSEFISGTLLRRQPRIAVSAVHAAMKIRHFDCSKALRELSLPQSPIEGAFQRAVSWFWDNGYVKPRPGSAH
jgi:dihydroflavonol-4-reductase